MVTALATWLRNYAGAHTAAYVDAPPEYLTECRANLKLAAAELERLEGWQREAMTVLDEWEKVWETAGRPGQLGGSKAEGVREWIEARK